MIKPYRKLSIILILITLFFHSCDNEDVSTVNQVDLFYKAFGVNPSPSPIKNKGHGKVQILYWQTHRVDRGSVKVSRRPSRS